MNLISLTPFDLGLAALLLLLLAFLSWRMALGVERQLLVASLRMVVQLLLIGLVLKYLFAQQSPWLTGLMAMVMLGAAGYEVIARQQRRYSGGWSYGIGAVAMFISSFTVTLLAMVVILQPDPWYQPRYAIPLLGMVLGNTMTGVAITLDALTRAAWGQRGRIEARLLMGERWSSAVSGVRRESLRAGLIPIVNSMSAIGVVSLPGMMTGQILAGAPPVEAVKYQLLIMFLIAAGTGFGALAAVWFGSRRLFDERQRLRLDRLMEANN